MEQFNFTEPAELFATLTRRSKRAPVTYKRFDTGAEAVKYAVEVLSPEQLYGSAIESGEERFEAAAIRELYESAEYPLQRTATPKPAAPAQPA